MHANFLPCFILARALYEIDGTIEAQRGTRTCPSSRSWEEEKARCDISSKTLYCLVKLSYNTTCPLMGGKASCLMGGLRASERQPLPLRNCTR